MWAWNFLFIYYYYYYYFSGFYNIYLSTTPLLQQVKIWEDRKPLPLSVLKPHDGNPVNSVTFLTAPHRPDHIVLITAVSTPILYHYVEHVYIVILDFGVSLE